MDRNTMRQFIARLTDETGPRTAISITVFLVTALVFFIFRASIKRICTRAQPRLASNALADQKMTLNSPHDSGYASSAGEDEEEDPAVSSLRRAIRMCDRQARTPREGEGDAFEVFESFARASSGSGGQVGLGVEMEFE